MTPDYYSNSLCGELAIPNVVRAIEAGQMLAPGLPHDPDNRTTLVLIDFQVAFASRTYGSLYVNGAEADVDRTNVFIYNRIREITNIYVSLDTHELHQPFHSIDWAAGPNPCARISGGQYQTGDHPEPFTVITAQDIKNGVWQPVFFSAEIATMVEMLESLGRKQLMIWPYHCLLGTPGHALDPSLFEAIAFHAAARGTIPEIQIKGRSRHAEHYGLLRPEVQLKEDRNEQFLTVCENSKRIYIAGEASSHCVLETLNQLDEDLTEEHRRKIFVLTDCMSPVEHPTIDFRQITEQRFQALKERGFNFITSTEALE